MPLETAVPAGLGGPFDEVVNALPNGYVKPRRLGKVEADPKLQGLIHARILTQSFGEKTAAVAAHTPSTPRHPVVNPPLLAPLG